MHNTVYRLVNTVVAITPTLVTALPKANVYVSKEASTECYRFCNLLCLQEARELIQLNMYSR